MAEIIDEFGLKKAFSSYHNHISNQMQILEQQCQLFDAYNRLKDSVSIGSIIVVDTNEPITNYLECDGGEYNIEDYIDLSTYIEEKYGVVNYFGGDGITTFGIPKLKDREQDGYWSPTLSSDTDPTPYRCFSSSIYSVYKAFNCFKYEVADFNTYWHSNSETTPWVTFDFGSNVAINSIKLTYRYYKIKCDIQIQGSNNNSNFETLGNFTDIKNKNFESGILTTEFLNLDKNYSYRYYRIVFSNQGGYLIINNIMFKKAHHKYYFIKTKKEDVVQQLENQFMTLTINEENDLVQEVLSGEISQ